MVLQQFRLARDFVCVQGDDAESYLQSQLSNQIAGMAVRTARHSLLLDPTGKLVAALRVTRFEDTVFVLDAEPGFAESVVARLNRFKIRVKADIQTLDWQCVALRGVGARAAASSLDRVPSDGLAVDAWWGGDDAVDLVGASVADVDGIDSCSAEAFDAMRVATGWPAAGVDFAAGCIPAETGLVGVAVSFSKGCYPGQELVERMDSRAVTAPHMLRLVDDANFHVGDVIVEGVTVTSVGGGKAIVRAKRDVAEIGVALGPV